MGASHSSSTPHPLSRLKMAPSSSTIVDAIDCNGIPSLSDDHPTFTSPVYDNPVAKAMERSLVRPTSISNLPQRPSLARAASSQQSTSQYSQQYSPFPTPNIVHSGQGVPNNKYSSWNSSNNRFENPVSSTRANSLRRDSLQRELKSRDREQQHYFNTTPDAYDESTTTATSGYYRKANHMDASSYRLHNHLEEPTNEQQQQFYAPIRRQSITRVPGVATRVKKRNSMPADMQRLTATNPTSNDTDCTSAAPSLSSSPPQSTNRSSLYAPVPKISPDDSGRSITPCNMSYRQLGGIELGSLRITNPSLVPSTLQTTLTNTQASSIPTELSMSRQFSSDTKASKVPSHLRTMQHANYDMSNRSLESLGYNDTISSQGFAPQTKAQQEEPPSMAQEDETMTTHDSGYYSNESLNETEDIPIATSIKGNESSAQNNFSSDLTTEQDPRSSRRSSWFRPRSRLSLPVMSSHQPLSYTHEDAQDTQFSKKPSSTLSHETGNPSHIQQRKRLSLLLPITFSKHSNSNSEAVSSDMFHAIQEANNEKKVRQRPIISIPQIIHEDLDSIPSIPTAMESSLNKHIGRFPQSSRPLSGLHTSSTLAFVAHAEPETMNCDSRVINNDSINDIRVSDVTSSDIQDNTIPLQQDLPDLVRQSLPPTWLLNARKPIRRKPISTS